VPYVVAFELCRTIWTKRLSSKLACINFASQIGEPPFTPAGTHSQIPSILTIKALRNGVDTFLVKHAQEERIKAELLKRAADQTFRTLLGGPLAALVSFLTLKSKHFHTHELLWALIAGSASIVGALWCRKKVRSDTLTLWRFRAFAGLAASAMIAMPAAFHPAPNSRQAALEAVSVAISTVVTMTMFAADRRASYVALAVAIVVSVFTLSVISGLAPLVVILSAIAVFFSLAPLIETIHQPLRKSVELLFTNEQLVVDLQKANAGLSAQVVTDSLTGLANRVALENSLETEREVGILYLDLDHFKAVNDTLGHAAGDEVLLRVAEVLRRCTRENDLIARLGGDEFVILLDNAPLTLINEIAQRIRQSVQAEFVDVGISVSIGATVADLLNEPGARALARADRNLYQVKEQGRNQVLIR
jgi:diguanylate cyclase (GGDEF)-like protein